MNKALVIRMVGDTETCNAIAGGLTSRVIPLDNGELETVKAECKKLKDENALMVFGTDLRFFAACAEQAEKYAPEYHGPVYWTVLRVWALIWLGIVSIYDYLEAWNRGEFND